MAIDRAHLVRLLGGPSAAVPGYNLYEPFYIQYDPALDAHPIYGYDPHKAAALLKASGYHNQSITLYYENDNALTTAMAPSVAQDLQRIGLNVILRGETKTAVFASGQPYSGAKMLFYIWTPDYADGYDLYSNDFLCSQAVPSGADAAHYCDPVADDLMNRAEEIPVGNPRHDSLIRQAEVRLIRSAAHVPLIYSRIRVMVSPRVGGFFYNSVYGWQYAYYWLKR
jgi:ABC-type transport system substrate-binding protein